MLAHEFAHSLYAKAHGIPVKSITLFIFGGVSNIQNEPQTPGVEFWMALVGPLASLAIGVVSWLVALAFAGAPVLFALFEYLAVANLLLGVFNLIPGFPLDGGRVLLAILWKITGSLRMATRWAVRVGQFIAFLFILWGLFQIFTGSWLNGIWIAFIGWFMLSAAQSASKQAQLEAIFRGVSVGQVMAPPPPPVPANMSLRELVGAYLLPHGQRLALVAQGGQFAGLITLADVRHVPQAEWDTTSVGQVMIPLGKLHVAQPQQRITDVLPLMAQSDVNQAPVMRNGQLVGLLSRDAIVRYLDIRQSLGLRQPPTDQETRGPHRPPTANNIPAAG